LQARSELMQELLIIYENVNQAESTFALPCSVHSDININDIDNELNKTIQIGNKLIQILQGDKTNSEQMSSQITILFRKLTILKNYENTPYLSIDGIRDFIVQVSKFPPPKEKNTKEGALNIADKYRKNPIEQKSESTPKELENLSSEKPFRCGAFNCNIL